MNARLLGFFLFVVSLIMYWVQVRFINHLFVDQPEFIKISEIPEFFLSFLFVTSIYFMVIGEEFYKAFNVKMKITFLQIVWVMSVVVIWTIFHNIRSSAIFEAGYRYFGR